MQPLHLRTRCGSCANFRDSPVQIEAQFPGLTAMGSAYSSVRASDGICVVHDRYLAASCSCAAYVPRAVDAGIGSAAAPRQI